MRTSIECTRRILKYMTVVQERDVFGEAGLRSGPGVHRSELVERAAPVNGTVNI